MGCINNVSKDGILLVEDDPLVASSIEEMLLEAGYGVIGIVGSSTAALSYLEQFNPQLALIDIRLAGPLDGIELACLLRDKFSVPAIFLSGLADSDTLSRARVAKPLAFLKKPFLPSRLFNEIERALAR